MECPYCKKNMHWGYISASGGGFLYWVGTLANRTIFIQNTDGYMRLSKARLITSPAKLAWKCEDCKKLIVDYEIEDQQAVETTIAIPKSVSIKLDEFIQKYKKE